jgi:hypothetical protein
VTGPGGLSLTNLAVTYGGDCVNVTVANGCTASYTYAESANHLGSTHSASITITKANPTVSLTANDATYTGNPYPARTLRRLACRTSRSRR